MYVVWELAHLLTKFILTLIIKKHRKLTSRSRTWSISLLTRHSWVRIYWLPKNGSGRTLALQYTIILLYKNSELRISLSLNVKKIQLCQKINPIKSFLLSLSKNFSTVILEHLWTSQHLPQTSILNYQSNTCMFQGTINLYLCWTIQSNCKLRECLTCKQPSCQNCAPVKISVKLPKTNVSDSCYTYDPWKWLASNFSSQYHP